MMMMEVDETWQRDRLKKTCVSEDMNSLGLSQDAAQSRNK